MTCLIQHICTILFLMFFNFLFNFVQSKKSTQKNLRRHMIVCDSRYFINTCISIIDTKKGLMKIWNASNNTCKFVIVYFNLYEKRD